MVGRGVGAVLLAAAMLAGCSGGSPTPPPTPEAGDSVRVGRAPNAPFEVTGEDLGIHSYTTQPQVPTKTIRLACAPTWGAVEPVRGQYDWTAMDTTIARAESWGYSDILFSICGTPAWAGTPVTGTDVAVFGKGSAQPPRNLADWERYVSAMAQRYRGRITGYEVWNEPSSPQFFTGTPARMAAMSEVASKAIKAADPQAFVLSGSVQTHRSDFLEGFGVPYLEELARLNWPVDGIAAHFYTPEGVPPAGRVKQIRSLQRDLDRLDAPADLPLWDTEVNYDVGLAGGEPAGRITGDRAAGWTAQTFLDSWRTGVRRTYWYLWTQEFYSFPGIQMRVGDPSTVALNTLGTWVVGARFEGCDTGGDAVVCDFSRADSTFRIAWAERQGATLRLDADHEVCPITGSACQVRSGSLPLHEMPVRIT